MSGINSTNKELKFKTPNNLRQLARNNGSDNTRPGYSIAHTGKSWYSSKKVPYTPPDWSRICPEGANYAIEIMKAGVIIKKIKLLNQPFFVFGRFPICEIYMAHPTVSRYHAILQYKGVDDVTQPPGWYILDFGSAHGTYVNKRQITSKKYLRMRVGDQVEFGASSRIYILVGPEFDLQGEPNLTVAEIKLRSEELQLKKERKLELRAQRISNSLQEQNLNEQNSQREEMSQQVIEKEKEEEKLRKQKENEEEMLRKQKGNEEEMLRKQKENEEEMLQKQKENEEEMLLKQKDNEEEILRKKRENEMLNKQKEKDDEEGIDWGMGNDSEPEPDLADNPYASTTNEELYIQDPKKTLRGFFSREGVDLNYDCDERGPGQFSCRVQLPVDDTQGRPVIAEVIHRGKKKEAVVACALEACRILDRMGVLRQAKHESRRRKQRDWDADDYYDSEDDTFFDRTGIVEKKRQARMEKLGVVTSQPQSYHDLTEKIKKIQANILEQSESITYVHDEIVQHTRYTESVDDFLKSTEPIPNYCQASEHKERISKCKLKIKELQIELVETCRLAKLARPTNLAHLTKRTSSIPIKKTNSVVYGKRMRLREDPLKKPATITNVNQEKAKESEDFVIEVDSDEEEAVPSTSTAMPTKGKQSSNEPITCEKNTDPSTNTQNDNKKITNTQTDKKKITNKQKGHKNITNTQTDKSNITKTQTDKIKITNTETDKSKNVSTQSDKNKIKNTQTEKNKITKRQTDNNKIINPQTENNKFTNTKPAGGKKEETKEKKKVTKGKKMYGPARPPANYVIPDSYYDETNDRDLPEITEKSDI